MLNMEPLADVTATLLFDFLEVGAVPPHPIPPLRHKKCLTRSTLCRCVAMPWCSSTKDSSGSSSFSLRRSTFPGIWYFYAVQKFSACTTCPLSSILSQNNLLNTVFSMTCQYLVQISYVIGPGSITTSHCEWTVCPDSYLLFSPLRIEAVTSTGQMGSVMRLKQFLEVRTSKPYWPYWYFDLLHVHSLL